MTPTETLSHLRTLTDPTPEQLREASDRALLATGWTRKPSPSIAMFKWTAPNGDQYPPLNWRPKPCASIDDAVRWMVPEGRYVDFEFGDNRGPYTAANVWTKKYGRRLADCELPFIAPALALTIAGLAATLEGEK